VINSVRFSDSFASMNPSVYDFVSGGIERSDPECRGFLLLFFVPFNQLQQGGQAVGGRAPRLRACLIYLVFIRVRHQLRVPVLGLSGYNCLVRARVTVLLAAETNERALCVFISRKSRYFVLIDPMKAELEGRRETI